MAFEISLEMKLERRKERMEGMEGIGAMEPGGFAVVVPA
jgi:hypothetical protein